MSQQDREEIRQTIEQTAPGEVAGIIKRELLVEIERDLAELDERRARDGDQK